MSAVHEIGQVTAAFYCPACHWAEDAATIVPRMIDNFCPRCLTDGMEVKFGEELAALRLNYCGACKTQHFMGRG